MRLPPLGADQVMVGVALMVPPPLADRLCHLRRACPDQPPATAPPHITVLPPTPVAEADLPALASRLGAEAASFERFRVRLRGAGNFQPVSPVVFARVDQGFERCQALAARLRQAIGCPSGRFPYHPHVTVAQDAPEPSLRRAERAIGDLDAEFTVEAADFCQLSPDVVWQTLRRLPLAPAPVGEPSKEPR
ncbi:MAG: 2'-5' RNA ligase family protein [Bifidobacteriaceae bacterium]|jgi:2'-5' RNA ligase|nr:2'-5' RNA ligase family protein [Bifidobacteriaceae bacterium]